MENGRLSLIHYHQILAARKEMPASGAIGDTVSVIASLVTLQLKVVMRPSVGSIEQNSVSPLTVIV